MYISKPFLTIALYKPNRPVYILLLATFDMPFDLGYFTLKDKPTRKMKLLHFVIDCRVFVRSNESEKVLANRLENRVLSQ